MDKAGRGLGFLGFRVLAVDGFRCRVLGLV